jgi:hypothetical protein
MVLAIAIPSPTTICVQLVVATGAIELIEINSPAFTGLVRTHLLRFLSVAFRYWLELSPRSSAAVVRFAELIGVEDVMFDVATRYLSSSTSELDERNHEAIAIKLSDVAKSIRFLLEPQRLLS